jgi:hypothetical protein
MSSARSFVLCLSFANLCFLELWDTVANKLAASFAGVLIAVVTTAVCMWATLPLARRWPALRWIGVAALLLPLNLARVHVLNLHRQDLPKTAFVILGALAGFALIRWHTQIVRLPEIVALLFVLLPIQIGYALWQFAHPPSYVERPPAPLVEPQPHAQRVLWLLFDELDQHLVFENRPASVTLPEFDRIRREWFYADHVAPAAASTRAAIPLLLGDVFDRARSAGFNSAILGSELPYCRMYSVASCFTSPSATEEIALRRPTVLNHAWHAITSRVSRKPLFDAETRRAARAAEAIAFDEMRQRAIALATDTRYQLVFMHFPIPHLLSFWDRRGGKYSTADSSSYLDNLALADRTLGEIRTALEHAGQWNDTLVLVTSDHPLRDQTIEAAHWWNDSETASIKAERKYVPFLLRLAGPYELHAPFHATLTGDLLRAILDRRVTTTQQAAAMLAPVQK